MKILVTSFGPFGGRSRNASSLALNGLKSRLPWLNTRVLPVDSVVAPLRMTRALRKLRPDFVLMLGEAAGTTSIRLETTAWNELDFRIPDIAGRLPVRAVIDPRRAASLVSTMPWEGVCERLAAAGHAVEISSDPGRFLCNQLLFHTLDVIGRKRIGARAGFIHLPLECAYPTQRAVEALELAVGMMTAMGNSPFTVRG